MSDRQGGDAGRAGGRQPDDDAGGDRRRPGQAPTERHQLDPRGGRRTAAGGARASRVPARTRAILAAALVADIGAVLFFVLGLLDLGIGLLAVAGFAGWITGVALIWWGREAVARARVRILLAAGLGGWAIVLGISVDWAYGLTQGGVLGPLDYVLQRYGPLGLLSILAAALAAAARAR